jgi:CheY-specific phosphatase CheX
MTEQDPVLVVTTAVEGPRTQQLIESLLEYYSVAVVPVDEFAENAPHQALVKGVLVICGSDEGAVDTVKGIADTMFCMDLPVLGMVPLITEPRVYERMMVSGATVVMKETASPREIYEQVEQRCSLEAVDQGLQETIVSPLIESVTCTLWEMLDNDATAYWMYRKRGFRLYGHRVVVSNLTGRTNPTLVLSFTETSCNEISRRLLAPIGLEVTPELIDSSLTELCNIVTGQAKARLAGSSFSFDMTQPHVVTVTDPYADMQGDKVGLVIHFSGEVGDFALQFCLSL